MLLINNVSKSFGKRKVNDRIHLSIKQGEIFGLLGPNGSGKTTLVSQIIGLLKPDHGEIIIAKKNVIKFPSLGRKLCALQPQDNISLSGLTPRQAITLAGKLRQENPSKIKQRTTSLLQNLQLEQWADQPSEKLSGGIRRLTTFCMTAIVPRKLIILDEPTNDVDPIRRKLLWEQIRNLTENGATVLLITHNVLEAEKAVDRLAIIYEGKIIGLGTPAQLKADFDNQLRLQLTLADGTADILYPRYLSFIQQKGQTITLSLFKKFSTEAIDWVNHLQDKQIIDEYSLSPASLEDAYLKIIEQWKKSNLGDERYVFDQ